MTAPPVATMLAGWSSSPPADTYTPVSMASRTAACAALATAGASSSGMWSIAWAPNEIRYCVIHDSVVPAACSGRVLAWTNNSPRIHRSARKKFLTGPRRSAPASVMCPVFAEIITAAANYEQSNRTHPRWEPQFGYAAAQN